jgi:dGTP triphosphohydrolase
MNRIPSENGHSTPDHVWDSMQQTRAAFDEKMDDLVESAKRKLDRGEIVPERIIEELGTIALLPTHQAIRARHVLAAKIKGLELLGRYFKMFVDQAEIEVNDSLTVRLQRALERVSEAARRT